MFANATFRLRDLIQPGGKLPVGLIAGALAVLLAVLSTLWAIRVSDQNKALQRDLRDARGEVELLLKGRDADSRAIEDNARRKADISKKGAQAREKQASALKANQDWATQPIPAGVLDSLRD